MPATLSVDLNRQQLHDVAVADSFETDGSFVVALRNHGEAVHAHLHLDDELSRVARLEATNHFVDGGSRIGVSVDVAAADEPVTGKLKVVTGYGAETAYVDVTVRPDRSGGPVDVDERLAEPPRSDAADDPSLGAALAQGSRRAVALVAGAVALAVVLAVAVALTVDSAFVLLVVGAGVGAVLAAAAFALR